VGFPLLAPSAVHDHELIDARRAVALCPALALRWRPVTAALQEATVDVEIVVPVYNEQDDLPSTVRRLHTFLRSFPFTTLITIADNASTDATLRYAVALADELPGVRVVHLDAKDAAAPCARSGLRAPRRSSPTWTSTSRPTWRPCCRWWHR